MKAREILIALWIKHKQDWDKMYEDIANKNIDDNLEKYLENVDTEEFVTILDADYPEKLKHRYHPPFVI